MHGKPRCVLRLLHGGEARRLSRNHHVFQDFPNEPIDPWLAVILGTVDVGDGELVGIGREHRHRQAVIRIDRAGDTAVAQPPRKRALDLRFGQCVHGVTG